MDFNFDGLRVWDDDVAAKAHTDDGGAMEARLNRYAREQHEEYWGAGGQAGGQQALWRRGQAQGEGELFAGQGAGHGDDEEVERQQRARGAQAGERGGGQLVEDQAAGLGRGEAGEEEIEEVEPLETDAEERRRRW